MVEKKTSNTQQKKSGGLLIVVGLVILSISLFSSEVIRVFGNAACAKNSFGSCTLDSNIMTGILSTYVPYLIAVLGLGMVIYGFISSAKAK